MNILRVWIRRHLLIAFFIAACGFSWTLWALMIASARGWLPFNFPTNWTGSFGPSIAAILVVWASQGRAAVWELLRPLWLWRFRWEWYVFVLVGSLLPIAIAVLIFALLGNPFPASRLPVMDILLQIPFFFVVVFVLGGPLGEEIGWRGLALPRLMKQHSPLEATLIVVVIWLTWHLPLFWLPGAAQEGISIVSFAMMMLGYSVLFTWAYLGTAGSLFSILLLHTSMNTLSVVVSGIWPKLTQDPLFNWLIAIGSVGTATIVLVVNQQMMRKPQMIGNHA